jgi:hypothetical protein
LHDYLQRLDQGDADEDGPTGSAGTKNLAEKIEALRQKRAHYGSILEELERTGESQVSLTGPDSRAMAAHTKVGVGYNVQIAVDAKHKLIAEQAVTNDVLNMGLLRQTAEPAREVLGVETIDVVAGRLRNMEQIDYANPKACPDCPLRAHCTNDVRLVFPPRTRGRARSHG